MNLKKNSKIFLLTAAVLISCGCGSREAVSSGMDIDVFVYDNCENVHLMTVENDTLYTLTAGENNEPLLSVFDADGKMTAAVTVLSEIKVYNIKAVCAKENTIYAAIYNFKKPFSVCSFDISGGSPVTVCELDNLDEIEKIAVQNGKLYWLGQCKKEAKTVEPLIDKEGNHIYYSDSGKKMGCVDLESGESVESEIEFPVSFAVSKGKVTVYAFDEKAGFYFADYASPNDKQYTNKLGVINNFEFYGAGGEFTFVGNTGYSGILPVSKTDNDSGIIKAANGVYAFSASELCASESGFVWLKAADSPTSFERNIKRYDLSGLSMSGNPIRVISSQYYEDLPFTAGSEIKSEQLSEEGFALTVLSLDKNYDLAVVGSEQGFANEIKEKGSFYPLNDINGVSEYLDSCFPYIKESVTDSEGNICMLPVRVVIPLMIYNEKNCAENRIAFSEDPEAFMQSVKQASSVSGYYYDCLRFWTVRTQIWGYLSSGKTFDTEEFRRLAELLKEQCTEDIFISNFEIYSALMTMQTELEGHENPYYKSIYDKTLFTQLRYYNMQRTFINDENLRAAPMPVQGSGKNIAFCTFICVNPYSDRLSETLGYIESLVNAMSLEKNSCMLSDKSTYESTAIAQDLYSVYENGEIYFQIPAEIYTLDFEKYCADEITLEEFIVEAERKLLTYLNE